jgi:hypothetical protein
MHEELIPLLATAVSIVGARVPGPCLADLGASLDQACAVPVECGWERMLAALRAGDVDGAGLAMEKHLRTLHFMGRLAIPSGQRASA